MKNIEQYGYQVEIDAQLPAARESVVGRLKEAGFGVLTEIDVQATLREKLGIDWPPYRILGVCNPPLARAALEASPHVGLMLPCTVTLREENGRTIVEMLRPEAAIAVVGIEAARPSAAEAERRLREVVESLETASSVT